MPKKKNPRRQPVSQADISKLRREVKTAAVEEALALLFTALRDRMGWNLEQLQELWGHVNNLADSVAQGRITGISHVLKAMGYTDETGRGSLRLSIGWGTTEADVRYIIRAVKESVEDLRK